MPIDFGRFPTFLQAHFVPVLATFTKKGEKPVEGVISAFVVKVLGFWYLITAGHCITVIEDNRRNGYDAKFLLIDSLGPQKKHKQPIPFPIDEGDYASIDVDGRDDYAAIHVPEFIQRMMEANGIRPLDETVWKLQPAEVEAFGLVGIPDELLARGKGTLGTTTKFYFVEPIAELPEQFKTSDAPRFYGRIALGENETDISGVSGGPVFSFAQDDDGHWRYWLYAVQSSWVRDGNSGIIAACPVKPFIAHLESSLLEALEAWRAKNS